jgi:signal transduction histidine kinase
MTALIVQKLKLTQIRWWWVLLASIGAFAVSTLIISAIIAVYAVALVIASGGNPDSIQIEWFAEQTGRIGGPISAVVCIFGGALWVSRRVMQHQVLHGVYIGIVAGIFGQIMGWTFSGFIMLFSWPDLLIFLLSVGAGWLGGIVGRNLSADQEALYQASRAIGMARNSQEIIDAMRRYLTYPQVKMIALWETMEEADDSEAEAFPTKATCVGWAADELSVKPQTLSIPFSATMQSDGQVISPIDLSPTDLSMWEKLDIHTILLLPLPGGDGKIDYWLTVASGSRRFPGRLVRLFQTMGHQIALVLENLRLLEQARYAGILAERERLARDMHDGLGHALAALSVQLEAVQRLYPVDPQQASVQIDALKQLTQDTMASLQRSLAGLRTPGLGNRSVDTALQTLGAEVGQRAGIDVDCQIVGQPDEFGPILNEAIWRVAQEALTNVEKHARASRVQIMLRQEPRQIRLQIVDDGLGMPDNIDLLPGHYGLHGMRERVEGLGGELSIGQNEPGGTFVEACFPLIT